MAGRRVRCRDCGGVFALTADAAPSPPAPREADLKPARLPNGINAASPSGELADDAARAFRIPAPAATMPEPRESAEIGNPLDAPDLAAADSDAVFAQAFSEVRPAQRANYIHNFPYAYLLDRWVPPVAIGLSIGWLLLQISLGNESGVGWAIALRIFLVAVGYLLIALPLGWLGMTIGCRWARFARPPSALRRVVAATLFPYALLVILWLLAGSLAGAIPGILVCLVVAGGLAWLLYRPSPDESLQSMAAAAVAFLGGVALCTAGLLGVNAAAQSVARRSSPSVELVSSPVGPGLAWDVRPPQEPPPAIVSREPNPPVPDPVEPPAATLPSPMPSPAPATRPAIASPAPLPATRPSRPTTMANLPPDPLESSGLFGPGTRSSTPPADDPAPQPPPAVAPTPTGDSFGDRIAAARSPLVEKVIAAADLGAFERVVFPATPSPLVLIVRRAEGAEAIELWNLSTLTRVGSRLSPATDQQDPVTGNYAVSPDGQLVVRIGSFPTLGLDLISFADAAAPPHLPFPKAYGQARLVGFIDTGRVLVRWEEGEKTSLQVVDMKRQGFAKVIDLATTAWSPANVAIHPEGRLFAAIVVTTTASGQTQAELFVADLQAGQSRRVPVLGIDRQWAASPTGICFAADGRKLAILYERESRAAVLWLAIDPRALPGSLQQFRVIIPPEVGTTPPDESAVPPTGRLESLNGGTAWLVGGNAVIDAETGKSRGLLGVPELLGARAAQAGIVIVRDDEGQRRLVILKLSPPPATQPATAPTR